MITGQELPSDGMPLQEPNVTESHISNNHIGVQGSASVRRSSKRSRVSSVTVAAPATSGGAVGSVASA
jgi:hypothetical protein